MRVTEIIEALENQLHKIVEMYIIAVNVYPLNKINPLKTSTGEGGYKYKTWTKGYDPEDGLFYFTLDEEKTAKCICWNGIDSLKEAVRKNIAQEF